MGNLRPDGIKAAEPEPVTEENKPLQAPANTFSYSNAGKQD